MAGGAAAERGGISWDELVADAGAGAGVGVGVGVEGEARLDDQFLRANFQPTERYVMTRAGSVRYRLASGESGFANLKLAGDWTRNGIDGGSVEAAVTSGMQAARAISGGPRRSRASTAGSWTTERGPRASIRSRLGARGLALAAWRSRLGARGLALRLGARGLAPGLAPAVGADPPGVAWPVGTPFYR